MFDLAKERLAWIPIVWTGLKQSSPDALAEPCENRIELLAVILPNDQMTKIFSEGFDDDPPEDETPSEKDARVMAANMAKFKAVARDWRGVVANGEPIKMTDENIRAIFNVGTFPMGFETSYLKAWAGQIELAEKNSAASSGSGQKGEASANRKTRRANGQRRRR